jgi:hypothetical protein
MTTSRVALPRRLSFRSPSLLVVVLVAAAAVVGFGATHALGRRYEDVAARFEPVLLPVCVLAVLAVVVWRSERADIFNLARLVVAVYVLRWIVGVPWQLDAKFFLLDHDRDVVDLARAAMWLAVASLASFWFGWRAVSASWLERRNARATTAIDEPRQLSRGRVVAGVMFAIGFVAYVAYIVAIGLFRNPFGIVGIRLEQLGPRRSEFLYLASYLMISGTLVFAASMRRVWTHRLVLAAFLLTSAGAFTITEARWRALAAPLSLLVYRHYAHRRVRVWQAAALIAVFAVVAMLMVSFRSENKRLAVSRPYTFVTEAAPDLEEIRRFYFTDVAHFDALAVAIDAVPERTPYTNGSTFAQGAFGPVASKFYSTIGTKVEGAGETLTAEAYGVKTDQLDGALAPTLIGEAYLARGVVGVVVVFALFGLVCRIVAAGLAGPGHVARRTAMVGAVLVPNALVLLEGNSSHIFQTAVIAVPTWLALRWATIGWAESRFRLWKAAFYAGVLAGGLYLLYLAYALIGPPLLVPLSGLGTWFLLTRYRLTRVPRGVPGTALPE